MHYIYKITNKINGKIYIGKTSKTIQERFESHCKMSRKKDKRCSLIHFSMIKNGIDNFSVIQLCNCKTDEQANKMEIFFIKQYNTMDKSIGYNVSPGGDGCDLSNPVILQKLKDKTKEAMSKPEVKAKAAAGLIRYRKENPDWREKTSRTTKEGMNNEEVRNKLRGKRPPEFGIAVSKGKKGGIPWNKGLTKSTDTRILDNTHFITKNKVN